MFLFQQKKSEKIRNNNPHFFPPSYSGENKMTRTGKAKNKSFDYFEYHKLKVVAETTHANTLGENIRRTLSRAYPI